MKTYRFALIGCGRIAKKHYEAIAAIPNAAVAAVCDIVPERARSVGERLGVPWYTDYHEMLEKETVDIVNILTPSGLHAEHTIDVVTRYGKEIVCEKPMALRLPDADRMIRACDAKRVHLFVVKQNRYNRPVQKLREALDAGRFGRIALGTVRVRWSRDQRYYDQDAWRGTWAMDGGVVVNQASHHIDLLLWMLGEPLSVMAKSATYFSNIEVDDTALAIVTFRSGAFGLIEATTATRPDDLEGSLSVLGERGSVVIGGFAVNKMETWRFIDEAPEESAAVVKEFSEMPPNVYGYGHQRFLEHVVDCLEHGKHALIDGIEGRKTIELFNAIYESVETGREVSLHFEPRFSRLGKRQ